MNKPPSKYHRADWNSEKKVYEYTWDSTHPDLEPTKCAIVGDRRVCAYCGKDVLPIQHYLARFRDSWERPGADDYAVTGHCCICKGAEAERSQRREMNKLIDTFTKAREKVHAKYAPRLKINHLAIFGRLQDDIKSRMSRGWSVSESDLRIKIEGEAAYSTDIEVE